jgi:xanthine/CO dehydrogenase XdhC/CoxF family maturation factor
LLVKKYADSKAAYIGLIGSKPKIKQFERELEKEGLTSKAFENVHAPIGIPIGGKDPAEIAISILAEIIQSKNAKFMERSVNLARAGDASITRA